MSKTHALGKLQRKSSLLKKTKFLALASVALGSINVKAMDSDSDEDRGGYARHSGAAQAMQPFEFNMVQWSKNNSQMTPNQSRDLSNAGEITLNFLDFKSDRGGWVKRVEDNFPTFYNCTKLTIRGFDTFSMGDGANSRLYRFLVAQKAQNLEELTVDGTLSTTTQREDLSWLKDLKSLKNITGAELREETLYGILPQLKRNNQATASGYDRGTTSSYAAYGAAGYQAYSDDSDDESAQGTVGGGGLSRNLSPSYSSNNQGTGHSHVISTHSNDSDEEDDNGVPTYQPSVATSQPPVPTSQPSVATSQPPVVAASIPSYNVLVSQRIKNDGVLRANFAAQKDWDFSLLRDLKKDFDDAEQNSLKKAETFRLLGCENLNSNSFFLQNVLSQVPDNVKNVDLSESKLPAHAKDDSGEWVRALKMRSTPLETLNASKVSVSLSDTYMLGYDPADLRCKDQPVFQLKHISLKKSGITDNSAQNFGKVMARNPLEDVDLSNNSLTDNGLKEMAPRIEETYESDRSNPNSKRYGLGFIQIWHTLKNIDLSDNKGITDASEDALFKMLKYSKNLETVNLMRTGMSATTKISLQVKLHSSDCKQVVVQ